MRRSHGLVLAILAFGFLSANSPLYSQEVKPGQAYIYTPFFPERWTEKKQSIKLTPWEGKQVVFLTTTAEFDGKTMGLLLKRLDEGWKLYSDLVGQSPNPYRLHNGKVQIAAVPDSSFTCGIGCGNVGATGIELAGFYTGDYAQLVKQPKAFPHYYFYEMGRNYFVFGNRHNAFTTGFAVFMRYVCMDTLRCEDPDAKTREVIDKAESMIQATGHSFSKIFTLTAGLGEKDPRLQDVSPSDQPVMYASAMLKLRKDHGGNEWVKRFYGHLLNCPEVVGEGQPADEAQCLLWLIAASCAAGEDLSGVFADRWNMEIGKKTRAVLQAADWKSKTISPAKILEAIPAESLPSALAMSAPSFLTAERRKASLLTDGSFEEGKSDRWPVVSWRQNTAAATLQAKDFKAGKKSILIRTAEADDVKCLQTVAVKPNTQYLLCGWIKTKDVTLAEKAGKIGANLCVDGGFEASRSFVGTNDWTYATLVVDSAKRKELAVGARLGFVGSTVKGSAWFDDLVLIEVGKR